MDLNISVFQEPRGVMRILHFVFSICAFATITGYSGYIEYACSDNQPASDEYSYPFQFVFARSFNVSGTICQIITTGDFSSDAKFFVATGVLAMLYSIAIIFVYMKCDELYRTNKNIPLYDFLFTVVFGVLWLSSSAAWANGLTGLKTVTTSPKTSDNCSHCSTSTTNFSTLNISVIFGFLNFFLWAADLWFLYKETAWFQGRQPNPSEGA